MRRKSFVKAACPVARSLDVIGDWWSLLIVRNALHGAVRFSEFEQGLGLAKNILSARLQHLVEAGVFETRPSPERADRKEYHLTDKGRRLQLVLLALRQWGEENLFENGEEMTHLLERASGKPVRKLQMVSQDGDALSPDDVMVRTGPKVRR